jgi:pro-apoptotic serine protease NMA111
LKVNPEKVTDALVLQPDRARVGETVYVAGNAKGEKFNIHQGIIGQVDRNPVHFDSNIDYMTISTKPGAGSSGSPIVTPDGFLVGLLTGSRQESAICLASTIRSLQRVLKCIEAGRFPRRGTLQVIWEKRSWDKCSRLRLDDTQKAQLLKANRDKKGLLVAKKVFPLGLCGNKIREGDILIRVKETTAPSFDDLEGILDDNVNQPIDLLIQRAGRGQKIRVTVGNLHDLACNRVDVYSDTVFHTLTFAVARSYLPSSNGVFLAAPGKLFSGIDARSGAIFHEMDSRVIGDLDDLFQALNAAKDGHYVSIRYTPAGKLQAKYRTIRLDKRWIAGRQEYRGNHDLEGWQVTSHEMDRVQEDLMTAYSVGYLPTYGLSNHATGLSAIHCLVIVICHMSHIVDSDERYATEGFGCLLAPDQGLVLVLRKVVPHYFSAITVRIANSVDVSAKVVATDATQGFLIIKYDPMSVSAPLQAARFDFTPVKPGEKMLFVGLNIDGTVPSSTVSVTDCSAISLTPGRKPVYQPWFQEALTLDSTVAEYCNSGIVIGSDGGIRALWAEWHNSDGFLRYAAPIYRIRNFLEPSNPQPRVWNMEVGPVAIAECRELGLSEHRIQNVEDRLPPVPQLFRVCEVHASLTRPEDADLQRQRFQVGDIVIHLNGQIIVKMADFDPMLTEETMNALVLRGGKEVRLSVETLAPDLLETHRIIDFHGAILQQPHHGVRRRREVLPSMIFISSVKAGSLSDEANLVAPSFITRVNDTQVWDLDDFLREFKVDQEGKGLMLVIEPLDKNEPKTVVLKRSTILVSKSEMIFT